MAANHAPMAPCLFSEAVVKRLACSAGTSSAATASRVSSQARERSGWLTQPMTAHMLGRSAYRSDHVRRDLLIEGKPDRKVKDQVEVPDVITEPKHYGMHRHFTDAGCVLLFGGGVRRGHLHGLTADERPCRTLQDRVVIEDLHATILRTLGITPTLAYTIEERPFYVTRDGKGKAIRALLS